MVKRTASVSAESSGNTVATDSDQGSVSVNTSVHGDVQRNNADNYALSGQVIHAENIFDMFNSQFSVSALEKEIESIETDTKITLDSAKKTVRSIFENGDNDKKYVVDLSDDVKEALENGEVKFVQSKTGKTYAQLRKQNGNFGPKLSISEELEENGLSFEDIKTSIQMDAIADQLKNVLDTLKEIESQIAETRIDHKNDRIGLFYSGISLYMEAKQVDDISLKKQITSQALKAISDSNSQMIQEIRSDIEFLVNGQYRKRKNSISLIDERLQSIKQCYEIVYRSAIMKAMMYKELNEIKAMATALDEYSGFINSLIYPYIGILSELDKNSKFISSGPWGRISDTLIDCNAMKQAICSKEALVIEMRESYG